jgi:hypothetical protein
MTEWLASGLRHSTQQPDPLTSHHEREVKALLHRFAVHLVGQCGKADVLLVNVLGTGVGRSGAY